MWQNPNICTQVGGFQMHWSQSFNQKRANNPNKKVAPTSDTAESDVRKCKKKIDTMHLKFHKRIRWSHSPPKTKEKKQLYIVYFKIPKTNVYIVYQGYFNFKTKTW